MKHELLSLVVLISEVSAAFRVGSLFQDELLPEQYVNTWVVQLLETQHDRADVLAKKHGFINLGQVGNLDGYYTFQLLKTESEQLNKRTIDGSNSMSEEKHITQTLRNEPSVGFVEQQKRTQRFKKEYSYPNDPKFSSQWSLVNTGQTGGREGLDLNVEPVWLQGIEGTGVVVSVVDDGLEIEHPDLSPNYDSSASWDFVFDDGNPTPSVYSGDDPDDHGTSCAGEIAMAKDNNNCGVGVAFQSNIGCLKFNMTSSSDYVEAKPLGYKNEYIQVYSNSWGPSDIGFIVEGPGPLLKQTFKNAVNRGRDGKGSIFVWAAGNGGWYYDSCAADGYSSSIYTIAVGSADQTAGQASYDEECAAKMAVTYTFDSDTFSREGSFHAYNQIYTTTLNGKCTEGFTGTSASTPLVAGVIALALEANHNLTWRDVQYLVAYTSNPDELTGGEWSVNGGGLKVSHKFGFGAIDAEALVTRARRWISVPPQREVTVLGDHFSGTAHQGLPLTIQFTVSNISTNFLEHVVLTATLRVDHTSRNYGIKDFPHYLKDDQDIGNWLQNPHPRRGDIKMDLTSPQGTTSTLLPYRQYDYINDEGYDNWPFMSVHHWGEDPRGTWILTINFISSSGSLYVDDIRLTLYGTGGTPLAVQNSNQCDTACARSCSGPGPDHCDVCRELRVVSTLECVSTCPNGTYLYKGSYCTDELITNNQVPVVALAVSIPLSLIALIALVCTCLTCGLVWVYKRKKKERIYHLRYHVLQSDNDTSVPV